MSEISLKYLLEEKHCLGWQVVNQIKAQVYNYNTITPEGFIKLFTVRQMLTWRKMGLITITVIADALEKDGFYLRF